MLTDRLVRIDSSFFARPTAQVAQDLLGTRLISNIGGLQTAGTIVETEAYLDDDDLASHASWLSAGRQTMEMEPGTIYIYRSYGIHQMFNIVAKLAETQPRGAVLVRALEPVHGIDEMRNRRQIADKRQLCSGPGKLTQALAIGASLNRRNLNHVDEIELLYAEEDLQIVTSTRIGITRSADLPLRFSVADNPYVSGYRTRKHFSVAQKLDR